jgi:hypothetical protein
MRASVRGFILLWFLHTLVGPCVVQAISPFMDSGGVANSSISSSSSHPSHVSVGAGSPVVADRSSFLDNLQFGGDDLLGPGPLEAKPVVSLMSRRGRPNHMIRQVLGGLATEPASDKPDKTLPPPSSDALQQVDQQICRQPSITALCSRVEDIAPRFGIAIRTAFAPKMPADSDVMHAVDVMIGDTTVKSLQAQADTAKMSERTFVRTRIRLASLVLSGERWYKSCLDRFLFEPRSDREVIMYVDGPHRYDETPLRARCGQAAPMVVQSIQDAVGATKMQLVRADLALRPGESKLKCSDSVLCKLLQSHQMWATMLRVNGHLLVVTGHIGNHIQVLDRNTGECLLKALTSTNACTGYNEKAHFKVRMTSSDAASSNTRGEQGLVRERSASWAALHFNCEAHVAATVHKRTFCLLGKVPSFMLHVSLALRDGSGHINTFRDILRTIVFAKLRILRGRPPSSADAFRKASVKLFLPDPKDRCRAAMILKLANGDWSNDNRIEHYRASDELHFSDQAIAQSMCSDLVWALVPHCPAVYNPNRWGGAEQAFCDLGIIAAVHGLFDAAFTAFCISIGDTKGSDTSGAGFSWSVGSDRPRPHHVLSKLFQHQLTFR